MIEVCAESCSGCGRCVEACPVGALSLCEGCVEVDYELCRGCEACLSACPQGALTVAPAPLAVVEPRPLQVRPPAVLDVRPAQPAPVPWCRRVLPVLASVAGVVSELLPQALELFLSPAEGAPAARSGQAAGREERARGGHRARQRHRGRPESR